MKKYTLLYFTRIAKYCIFIGTPIFLLLFITALCFDVLENDILVAFIFPLVCALMVWLEVVLRFVWGYQLYKKQVKLLNMEFNDKNAERIAPKSLIFLSEQWLICSGRFVICKDFIKSISIRNQNSRNSMGGYYCVLKCVDNKCYRVFVPSKAEGKQIVNWRKGA